jgi:hypothetical protein
LRGGIFEELSASASMIFEKINIPFINCRLLAAVALDLKFHQNAHISEFCSLRRNSFAELM